MKCPWETWVSLLTGAHLRWFLWRNCSAVVVKEVVCTERHLIDIHLALHNSKLQLYCPPVVSKWRCKLAAINNKTCTRTGYIYHFIINVIFLRWGKVQYAYMKSDHFLNIMTWENVTMVQWWITKLHIPWIHVHNNFWVFRLIAPSFYNTCYARWTELSVLN